MDFVYKIHKPMLYILICKLNYIDNFKIIFKSRTNKYIISDLTSIKAGKHFEERKTFLKIKYQFESTGWSTIYDSIVKWDNFTYRQQIIFIYVLNFSWINEIYVKK